MRQLKSCLRMSWRPATPSKVISDLAEPPALPCFFDSHLALCHVPCRFVINCFEGENAMVSLVVCDTSSGVMYVCRGTAADALLGSRLC